MESSAKRMRRGLNDRRNLTIGYCRLSMTGDLYRVQADMMKATEISSAPMLCRAATTNYNHFKALAAQASFPFSKAGVLEASSMTDEYLDAESQQKLIAATGLGNWSATATFAQQKRGRFARCG